MYLFVSCNLALFTSGFGWGTLGQSYRGTLGQHSAISKKKVKNKMASDMEFKHQIMEKINNITSLNHRNHIFMEFIVKIYFQTHRDILFKFSGFSIIHIDFCNVIED